MQTDSWLGVELRHLLALQAVAEEGSFGRAARSLGYTQSAISQQIAALERIVGQRLIDRPGGPRPVTLTDAGTLLLTHARAINARLAAAQADLDAFGNGDSGPLSVGTYQSVGARVLPTLLAAFRAEWPKVDVRLVESADDRELLELVERGDIDLSFCVFPLEGGPFESVELMRDPYVLVVRRRLAARRAREAADAPRDPRPAADQLPHVPHDPPRRGAAAAGRPRAGGRLPLG